MNWDITEGKLVTKTEFGTYTISFEPGTGMICVELVDAGQRSMEGKYENLVRAKEAVETDHSYRQTMWENL